MSSTQGKAPLPVATLLATESCHLCDDAHQELERRAGLGHLTVEVVDVDSERGRALLSTHRPTMFPLVLIDGQVLGHGRLSRRRLDGALRRGGAR